MKLVPFLTASAALCILTYLVTALTPIPLISLLGCAICGFSVGIMWPGTLSLATATLTQGSVRMFALLAVAGDLGCLVGPSVTGWIADASGGSFTSPFLFATLFPLCIFLLVLFAVPKKRSKQASL